MYDRNSLDTQLSILFGSGEVEGWVTMQKADPVTEQVTEEYFLWPKHREQIHRMVENTSPVADVRLMPALFENPTGLIEDVLGSYVAWVDLDNGAPSAIRFRELGLEIPTLTVQSSLESRLHLYWRLDSFCTDLYELQVINRNLAYAMDGDTGGWQVNHGLRPVSSINHKHGLPVKILHVNSSKTFSLEDDFQSVPMMRSDESILDDFNAMLIPDPNDLILDKQFHNPDVKDLLKKQINDGEAKRHAALMRLAYGLCEEGLDNGEVFSLVAWKAEQWGKFMKTNPMGDFVKRHDFDRQIKTIVAKARVKVPYKVEEPTVEAATTTDLATAAKLPTTWKTADNKLTTFGVDDLIEHTDEMEWLIPGILPKNGLMYVAGPPGSGKTVFCQELCWRLCTGEEFLGFGHEQKGKKLRVLILSLEMPRMSIRSRWVDLRSSLDLEARVWVKDNLQTYAEPFPLNFSNMEHLTVLGNRLRDEYFDLILVDSATVSMANSLSDEESVKKSLQAMYMIRNVLNCAMIVIAHTRKSIPGSGHKPKELDDLFGSQAIGASADAVIGIERERDKENDEIGLACDIRFLKTRFKNDFSNSTSFPVVMSKGTGLMRKSGQAFNELIAGPVPKQARSAEGPSARETFGI